MSHKNKVNLSVQAQAILSSFVCFGRSKHGDKELAKKAWASSDGSVSMFDYINNYLRDKIYCSKTYDNYAEHINYFIKWVESNHPYKERKTIDQIRQYVPEWLEMRKQKNFPHIR